MEKIEFLEALQSEVDAFNAAVATPNGDWVIKGFIDIARNVYTISMDTKVISKIMELLLFPELTRFAEKHQLKMVLSGQQNFYPDISFVDEEGHRFALDIKSTYRIGKNRVNGMTLGAFTGYFRERNSTKNVTFPYGSYNGHFVLGVIYSKADDGIDERRKYTLDELERITSVIRDFQFFAQEKYRIASDRPGSGNTKNIGSVTEIDKLLSGSGPSLGEAIFDDYWMYYLTWVQNSNDLLNQLAQLFAIFDDYWMYYLTRDMARAAELKRPPYTSLRSYLKYKGLAK
jgi:hypothetical protein